MVATVSVRREAYDLAPIFYSHLEDPEDRALLDGLGGSAQEMLEMRARLAQSNALRHRHQAKSGFVDAAELYCKAVTTLARTLEGAGAALGGHEGHLRLPGAVRQ